MNASHTPGPWHYRVGADPHNQGQVSSESTGATVAITYGDEGGANAHLIAAAPDLLAALEAFDQGFRDGSIKWAKPRQADSEPYHPANIAMCAAIARAKGTT